MRFIAVAFITALCFLAADVAAADTDLEREREIAEQVPLQVQRIPSVLPTADELANPELYRPHNDWVYTPPAADTLPPPPEDAVLRPGEFDEMDSTIIAIVNYGQSFQTMWADMMEAFQHGGHTYVVFSTGTLSLQNAMTNLFEGRDIDPESYTYLEYPIDSIWIRDYGPEFGLEEDGTRFIFDADYSRPNDDLVPIAMAEDDWINEDGSPIPYYSTGHRLSGGNIMSDGKGTCFFSHIVYGYEKPAGWSDADVDDLMRDYLGCEQIISLNSICLDATGHIDLYAKVMGETSILLSEYPSDTYFTGTVDSGTGSGHCSNPHFPNDYQDQEDNLAIIEASTNVDGDPWQITRLPMLEPYQSGGYWVYRSHMNSEVFNGHVAMPSYYAPHGGETAADLLDAEAAAVAAYEASAPGIVVHPIDADHIIDLGGAMHCISHEIPTARPWAGWPQPVVDAGVDSGADTGGDDDGCGCNALGTPNAPTSLLSILL